MFNSQQEKLIKDSILKNLNELNNLNKKDLINIRKNKYLNITSEI